MLSNPKLVSGMQKEGFNYWVDGEGKVLGLHNDYWSLKKRNKEGFHQRIITLVSSKLGKDFGANIHATFHLLGANEICSLFIEPANRSLYINEGHDMEFYLKPAMSPIRFPQVKLLNI